MGRKYAKPPLVEAVCEFRLSDITKWDLTVAGLLYEKLKKDFPHIEQRQFSAVEVEQAHGEIKQKTNSEQRVLFFNANRSAFIQVGARMLAVNCLSPYPQWEGFCGYIVQSLNALKQIVDVKGMNRLGLRYLNRIEVPNDPEKGTVSLDTYFDYRPFLGRNLPQNMASFLLGVSLPFDRDVCKIILTGTLPEKPNHQGFSLDLDYATINGLDVESNEIDSWIESAHRNLESAFEGCISDPLREIFEEIK